jgi:hypothetical protein
LRVVSIRCGEETSRASSFSQMVWSGGKNGSGLGEADTPEGVAPSPLARVPTLERTQRGGCARRTGLRFTSGHDGFNDPSAGSPTETLLRLLLPLNGRV